MTTEGFRERQAANDRIFQNMTEAIRGTETYADPGVGNIELPGGFAEVWSTGTGTPTPPAASTARAVSSMVSGRPSSSKPSGVGRLGRGRVSVDRPVQ